jgi:hypothetical protein
MLISQNTAFCHQTVIKSKKLISAFCAFEGPHYQRRSTRTSGSAGTFVHVSGITTVFLHNALRERETRLITVEAHIKIAKSDM